jgi:transcriptional regulator with XRE-family HTH domain
MTDKDIAKLCGVHITTAATWRWGTHLPLPVFAQVLAERLHIPIRAILPTFAHRPATPLDDTLLRRAISSEEVAKACGSTSAAVRMWRYGTRKPSLEFAKSIHKTFGIPLSVIRPDVWTTEDHSPDWAPTDPAAALDAALISRGISTNAVSQACGISTQAVSMWRSGQRRPSIETATLIHRAFNIPLHEIRPDIWPAPRASNRDDDTPPPCALSQTASIPTLSL